MNKQELLTIYVNLALELLAAPDEAKYAMDTAVSLAYHAYINAGGTNREALAAVRAARGKE